MRTPVLIALASILVLRASAQRSGFAHHGSASNFAPAGLQRRPAARMGAQNGSYFGHHLHRGDRYPDGYGYGNFLDSGLSPYGFFPPDLYVGDGESVSAPQAAPPQLQQADLQTEPSPEAPSTSQPLLIELQGDHYVRINGDNSPPGPQLEKAPEPPQHAASAPRNPSQSSLPPVVLVFRDGHSEEVRDYTIANGMMYMQGDYYTDGYWNKQIALSALDIPATLSANQARGIHFVLPSAPNEVITRP